MFYKRKFKLSATSTSWEVTDSFIPFSDGNGKKLRSKYEYSFELLTECTNNKSHMAGSGKNVYKEEWDVLSSR